MTDSQKELHEGGFHLNTDGLNCLPCKCRRKTFHKKTKINNEGKTIIEERSSWKVGGRGVTPDENEIFKLVHKIMKVLVRFLQGGKQESPPQKRG